MKDSLPNFVDAVKTVLMGNFIALNVYIRNKQRGEISKPGLYQKKKRILYQKKKLIKTEVENNRTEPLQQRISMVPRMSILKMSVKLKTLAQ